MTNKKPLTNQARTSKTKASQKEDQPLNEPNQSAASQSSNEAASQQAELQNQAADAAEPLGENLSLDEKPSSVDENTGSNVHPSTTNEHVNRNNKQSSVDESVSPSYKRQKSVMHNDTEANPENTKIPKLPKNTETSANTSYATLEDLQTFRLGMNEMFVLQ